MLINNLYKTISATGLILAACTNPDLASYGEVGTTQENIIHENGLSLNGLSLNGLSLNGLSLNGLSLNGLSLNGLSLNGVGHSGLHLNGLHLNGLADLYINEIGENGVGLDGMGISEVGSNGNGSNGIIISGIGLDGVGVATIGSGNKPSDPYGLLGVSVNGMYIHGVGENGIGVAGVGLREIGLDGLKVNGLDGLQINAAGDEGPQDFTKEREASLEVALYHLVGCALAKGDSVTITAADGTPKTYAGLRGLATGWKNGPLPFGGERRVRACLESSSVATLGLGLNSEQAASLAVVFKYAIECALPEEESVTIYAGDGTPKTYEGFFGLAPEWREGPLSAAGGRRVSACLASRTNPLGQTVALSLRHQDIPTLDVEIDIYNAHEGAFWGDIFAAKPTLKACVVDSGGLSGRVCSDSRECGFILMGDCADVCAHYDAINGYSECGEEGTTAVINTFLSLGKGVSVAGSQVCTMEQPSNESSQLACWGDNRYGQLADGTTDARRQSELVSKLGDDVVEAAMGSHACARQHDGSLLCWGRNDSGQVGDGTNIERHRPVHVADDVATFTVGQEHTCAVRTDGSVACWGKNHLGQLGLGKLLKPQTAPQVVPGLESGVARLARSTAAEHTCAVNDDGTVRCWGRNDRGQLGDGNKTNRHTPVVVSKDDSGHAFDGVTEMCTSENLSCARKADGTLWCWGDDIAARPRLFATDVAAVGVTCGAHHACFVRDDATVWCLGDNAHDQLGHDTNGKRSYVPLQVKGLDAVSHVNAGRQHTCATREDNSLWCWGTDPGLETLDRPLFPVTLSATPKRIALL